MTNQYGKSAANRAADKIRKIIGDHAPEIGIVLGSGLGGLADDIENAQRIAYADIPGFPSATVQGHAGALVAGELGGRNVIALAGRFHMYEGHSAQLAGFPVRVMHALGAPVYFASNAAGGIRPDLAAGDLMVIEDHLNLTGVNPLTGHVEEGDERFPDMTTAYDAELRNQLRTAAAHVGVVVKEGVYACLPGPSFETRAEIRMLDRLGADAVGMSTVPEVIVARTIGMRVAGMSCIANAAAGTTDAPVLHTEVLEVTARAARGFQAIVREFVSALPTK
ncbi:MAG TPA: purine-nucleoside phosphorylase [Gemmatimonadaceae bacterium]